MITTRSNKLMVDVTMSQTNKLEYLKRMVKDAETVVAKAQANYNAMVTKASNFAALYTEKEADKQTAEGYWKQFLQVKSDVKALDQTANEANLVAVDAFYGVRSLIISWQQVVEHALNSGEAIMLAADYIQKRKASNPLISNDLVTDMTAAVKKAESTIKAVIKAFMDALKTLSSASSANNSTELTDVFIGIAIASLLSWSPKLGSLPISEEQLKELLKDTGLTPAEILEIIKRTLGKEPLEASLKSSLTKAREDASAAQSASQAANREMNKAKEKLSQAEASLETWNAALNAAETAVAG